MKIKGLRSLSRSLANAGALALTGISIGWLVGLSTSPVIQKVLESALVIATTVVAALAGVRIQNADSKGTDGNDTAAKPATAVNGDGVTSVEVSAIPLAAFSLLLAIGTTLGLAARAKDWFTPDPAAFMVKWQAATGIKKETIGKLLLESSYPDLSNLELRERIAKELDNLPAKDRLVSLAPYAKAAFPEPPKTGGTASLDHGHVEVGLKNHTAETPTTLEACEAIRQEEKANPSDFNLVAQISNKFPAELEACKGKGSSETQCATTVRKLNCS